MPAEAVVWSTWTAPCAVAWNEPSGPSVTARRSGSSPTQENTSAAPAAASAGVAARRPPPSLPPSHACGCRPSPRARLSRGARPWEPHHAESDESDSLRAPPRQENQRFDHSAPIIIAASPAPRFRTPPMRSAAAKPKADARTEREMANAIRALAMDAVQAANSGIPADGNGRDRGRAWRRHLRHNPTNPPADRDRFVLSNGRCCSTRCSTDRVRPAARGAQAPASSAR